MLDGVGTAQKSAQSDSFSVDEVHRWVDYLRWLGVKVEEPTTEKFEE
ncbi:hypothetical protein MFMK1_001787 [Metallumcola ferriviriculae]|uniref:Uncharacterized protein n=1 Tax=Metallumcola ferriviriculae TaxID=3039180 RepID=A0AAU0UP32_9FIRM|nr:hypothetical protein MFMK1_001787 [Desulfitibacteraceae bacterium MK1]